MKILLFGADGQLGRRLRNSLASLGELTALARAGDGLHCGDLADTAGLVATVRALRPDVIVNAAAYTAVDRAEAEPDAAFAVNARACEALAREACALDSWLVHFSTDYVFDGSGSKPWRETDPTAPLNVYGRSKLAGEQAIAEHCPRHLVFRTSWVFDSGGQNFLKAILNAASQRDSLQVVDDQWGSPTGAALLAGVTAQVLQKLDLARTGLYHLAAAGDTNRRDMAVYGIECAQREGLAIKAGPGQIHPVPTSAMPAPAQRPLNSRLDTGKFRQAFGIELPPWQDGVRRAVHELAVATMKQ